LYANNIIAVESSILTRGHLTSLVLKSAIKWLNCFVSGCQQEWMYRSVWQNFFLSHQSIWQFHWYWVYSSLFVQSSALQWMVKC